MLNRNDTLEMLIMWKGQSLYGANELTCAVKSIVIPDLVIRKNETTYGKQG